MADLIIIPERLRDHALTSGHFADLGVYLHLCRLDTHAGDHTFVLPARSDMAVRCRCAHQVLARSYHCLEQLGLLAISQPGGRRGVRRQVRLERLIPTITTTVQVSEGVTIAGRSFTAKVQELHSRATRPDRRSNTLSDFPLDYLSRIAGNPSDADLLTAIEEVERFDRPAGGFIYSIVSVFLSRFQKGPDGQYNGKLDARRKNQMHETKQRTTKKPAPAPSVELANIHPTEEHPAARIDWICYSLLDSRSDLCVADVPLYLLDFPSIVRDQENRLSLHPRATLVKVHDGYWLTKWSTTPAVVTP